MTNWQTPFSHQSPREILFGPGQSALVGPRARDLGAERVLLVVDDVVWKLGIAERAIRSLTDAGIDYELFTDVEPEPSIESLEPCIERAKGGKIDALVAIGGGSAIDTAKGVGVILANGGQLVEYLTGGRPVERPIPPLIAVPTTAGTGSEVSSGSSLHHEATHFKGSIGSPKLRPTIAIVDPELTYSMPPRLTADCGIDALAHAAECYANVNFHPLADTLALEAIRIITRYLARAVADGGDHEARIQMHYGSLLAGLAFTNGSTGDGHTLSFPLSALFRVPHGRALGILLPAVFDFILPACADRVADIAVAMGEDVAGLAPDAAGRRAVEAMRRLAVEIGIKDRLRDFGVTEGDFPAMADQAIKRCRWVSARKLTPESATAIYRSLL